MSNLPLKPLKPLKWVDESDADVRHIAQSALHNYTIQNSEVGKKYEVKYESRRGVKYSPKPATGFATIEDAKTWCWNHYNEKMQPYVKPSPTWISVDDRLPEEDGLYFAFYPSCIHERQVISFSSNIKRFNLFHDSVTHWMLLPNPPEFSTMQDLHKGGGCE